MHQDPPKPERVGPTPVEPALSTYCTGESRVPRQPPHFCVLVAVRVREYLRRSAQQSFEGSMAPADFFSCLIRADASERDMREAVPAEFHALSLEIPHITGR